MGKQKLIGDKYYFHEIEDVAKYNFMFFTPKNLCNVVVHS